MSAIWFDEVLHDGVGQRLEIAEVGSMGAEAAGDVAAADAATRTRAAGGAASVRGSNGVIIVTP